MNLFDLLLFVHILAVAVWLGGAIVGTLIGMQLRKLGDVQPLARFCAAFAHVAAPLFGGSGLVVLLTGIGMVGRGYPTFSDLWVSVAFVGWLVSMVIGASLAGRNWHKASLELNADGATLSSAGPRIATALTWTWIDIALRIALVLLMVWRPT